MWISHIILCPRTKVATTPNPDTIETEAKELLEVLIKDGAGESKVPNGFFAVISEILVSVYSIASIICSSSSAFTSSNNSFEKLTFNKPSSYFKLIILVSQDINQVTIYYVDEYNGQISYVPVTKYMNDKREKIDIIIDELIQQISVLFNSFYHTFINFFTIYNKRYFFYIIIIS